MAAALPKPKSFEKFHCESNTFITTTDEINASELQDYLTYRILNVDFFENTTFCTVAGIHHGKDQEGKVIPGMTDYALLQGFDYKVFNALRNLKNEKTGQMIWNEMNFKKEIIPITCQEKFSLKPPFTIAYEVSESSKADLKDLAAKLVEQTKPYVVIFASCFSYQSEIRDFLVENGVLATLDITNDRGKISCGRLFALDKVQKEVHEELRQVKYFKIRSPMFIEILQAKFQDPTKSMFLIGSSGTGKTLALVNALKTKVSYYKRKKKQIKLLLCANGFSTEWAKDMKSDKYGLQTIIEEFQCEPMSLEENEKLFEGNSGLFEQFFTLSI